MATVQAVDKTVNRSLSFLSRNPVLSDLLFLVGIVYASRVVPMVPGAPGLLGVLSDLTGTFWFRVVFLALIVWSRNDKPVRSFAIALVFMITLNVLSGKGYTESFGLMAQPLAPVTYFMKDRAQHEADFRAREWSRRDPNRVSAIVLENDRVAQNLLNDSTSDESVKVNKMKQLNRQISRNVSDDDSDKIRGGLISKFIENAASDASLHVNPKF